jgi:hypothetical protein
MLTQSLYIIQFILVTFSNGISQRNCSYQVRLLAPVSDLLGFSEMGLQSTFVNITQEY